MKEATQSCTRCNHSVKTHSPHVTAYNLTPKLKYLTLKQIPTGVFKNISNINMHYVADVFKVYLLSLLLVFLMTPISAIKIKSPLVIRPKVHEAHLFPLVTPRSW